MRLYWVNVSYLLKSRNSSIYRLHLHYKAIGIKLNQGYLYDLKAGRKVTPNIFILYLIASYLKEPLFKLFTYNYHLGIEQDVNVSSINEF